KVVSIKGFTKPRRAVRLLHECSELAMEGLEDSLGRMMGQVDDALFELAEKAENNVIQTLYFDAMREVRRRRKDMEAVFRETFLNDCHAVIEQGPQTGEEEQDSLSLEGGLSLVEDNHLETSLAVTNMVAKVEHLCKEELFALDTRVALLFGRTELDGEENPFNPTLICNAFKTACEELDADIKVHLIILKLFEKFVVPDLRQVYKRINEHLARNNILPRINYAIRRQPSAPVAPAHGTAGEVVQYLDEGGDPFTTMQQLLIQRQAPAGATWGGGAPLPTPAGAGGSLGGGPTGGGIPPQTGQLISHLTQLQHGNGEIVAGLGIDASVLSSGTTNVLRQLKEQQLFGALPQEQDHTIDIVSMLFDYILEDKDIPERMKALIGRLQIPVLKVVMLDKTFFSRKNHPARKFLDTLSQAAIGFTEEKEADALYVKAEELIQRILSEFEDEVEIFDQVLEELQAYLARVEQEAAEAEARLREEAAEQERMAKAREKAAEEVRRRLEESELNDVVRDFITEHWKTLLMMTFLMEGDDSDAWLSSVETMDRLIWSIAPKNSPEERKRLVAELPGLLNNLQQGMRLIDMPARDRDEFFTRLAQCHSEAVSPRGQQRAAAPSTASTREESASGEPAAGASPPPSAMVDASIPLRACEGADVLGKEAADDDAPAFPSEESASCPDDKEPTEAREAETADLPGDVGQIEDAGSENWSDGIDPATAAAFDENSPLLALQRAAGQRAAEILAQIEEGTLEVEEEITLGDGPDGGMVEEVEDEYTRMVQEMENGTWVAFSLSDGSSSQEKLTWINAVTGIYMFTNRNGKNTRNLTFYQFAEELRQGRAKVVAEVPLVDRAMDSLMKGLKA
ncbi:MAG TPA: DUF1631 family protein, partial [Gammaproteobacteria bacterium]|nr:DUF1631 family protein [Gammaproteobacteria bacterium]